MPYVEVWIEDPECSGDCRRAEKAHEAMEIALERLREGDHIGAIRTLGSATGDHLHRREADKEKELANLYSSWLKQPIPRPEFLTFAHKNRKLSAS